MLQVVAIAVMHQLLILIVVCVQAHITLIVYSDSVGPWMSTYSQESFDRETIVIPLC